MKKLPRQAFTVEFKTQAVDRVAAGQSITAVSDELGINDQTLRNWVKASQAGKLAGAGAKVITPTEMELSRLRAELAKAKRENEILKKAAAYFAQEIL
jgi:transposase